VYENIDDDDAVELEDLDDFAEEEEPDVDFLLEELLPCESEDLFFVLFSDEDESSESLESMVEEDDSASEVSFSGDEVEPSSLQANNVIAIVAMIDLSRKVFIVPSFP
jgi:hypothetical protein